MRLYDWEELRNNADARDLCERVLGMKPVNRNGEWWHFNNPWRPGSDSGAFSVSPKGYKDHVSGESGSALDLIANARYGGDIWQAQEWLGEYLKLTPKQTAKQKRKFVCAYDYVDAAGTLVHQTVRWQPKEFTQRRPDPEKPGEWIWNLKDIEPVLYRLPALISAQAVCIVGGEKDADSLVSIGLSATTNPMGEGNWRDSYNAFFAGKHVVIIPDRDEVGRRHGETVSCALRSIAASVRVVSLPFPEDAKPAKDATDWIVYHRNAGQSDADIKAGLLTLFKATPVIDPAAKDKPVSTQREISAAKKANAVPFSNYTWENVVDERGKDKTVKTPRHINVMRDDLFTRFWGFPRRIGSSLFDHDRDSRRIRIFDKPSDLMVWVQEKSKHNVDWAKVEGCVTEPEFYASVLANTDHYQAISGVPNWPLRKDVYYTHDALPDPDPEAKRFIEFCGFFNPSSEGDWHLLRAFIASPLYYRPKVDRPLWVIDATSGQGTGKTRLAEMVTLLYGGDDPDCGEPAWIDAAQLNNETTLDRSVRRLLSSAGRKKRVALIDNVTGYFRSPPLATLITQGSLSGLAPYGHGEETRPNDLTWVLTSNSATLDRDLSDRSQIIKLSRPEHPRPKWAMEVVAFIREHRMQIISDIIGILDRGPQFDFVPVTRFREWEREVLAPVLGDRATWETVMGINQQRQRETDGDIEDAQTIRQTLQHKLSTLGLDPDTRVCWIQNRVLAAWISDAIPGFGGKGASTQRGTTAHLKNMVKVGVLPELQIPFDAWPHRGSNRHRGFMWNESKRTDDTNVQVIGMDGEGVIRVIP